MRLFAIGDLQGCLDPLQRLLEQLCFDPATDHLWFCGDLVNRGPQSLQTLRYVRDLGDRATVVLGNHDLHLLAVAAGVIELKKTDTLQPVLQAPDRDELLEWLRYRPLAVYQHDLLLVHAGAAPQWDVPDVVQLASEVEQQLRSKDHVELLKKMYADQPDTWNAQLRGYPRLRCIINYLTRLRYCDRDGRICHRAKGPPGTQPDGYLPWFQVPGRALAATPVVFGHWSTLGAVDDPNVIALDSGCVWGGALSAVQLLPCAKRFSVPCEAAQQPR